MHSFYAPVIGIILSASTCSAAPGFMNDHSKMHRVAVNATNLNGGVALHKIYTKYGWTVPDRLEDVWVKETGPLVQQKLESPGTTTTPNTPNQSKSNGLGSGQVVANPAYSNTEFLCPVTIGGHKLQMNLDTGSSDLWIFNTFLPDNERGSHTLYDPAKSRAHTYINGANFKVSYADGSSSSGEVATDTVLIGGISVSNQAVSLPKTVSSDMVIDPSDGILGLGFRSLNSICMRGVPDTPNSGCTNSYGPAPQPTWFENAKAALRSGLFTVNFKDGTVGYYNFGSVDLTAARQPLSYVPVDSSAGYWQVRITGVKGANQQFVPSNGAPAVVDTGSSLVVLEVAAAQAYWKQVNGARLGAAGWIFPCDTALPDLTITFDGYDAVIPGKFLNYAAANNGDATMCFGGLQQRKGEAYQIIGGVFFKAQLAVFDYDNLRLGFAPHR